jgi:hypothetical protein
MPTPPVYTSDFEVIGGLAEAVTNGASSWGYFRSAPIGVTSQVNYAAGTSSYDYDATAYANISATTQKLYRTWFPFQLQAIFNPIGDGGFVFRGYDFTDPNDYDYPFVAEEDFAGGVVGATVAAYDFVSSVPGTFTVVAEAGNRNGVAQATTFGTPITAITLP